MGILTVSIRALLFVSCLAVFKICAAAELPDALQDASPQQLMAVGLGMMELDDDRKAQFGKTVDDFAVKTSKSISKIIRRNEPGMPRKIGKKLSRAFKDLDKQVESIVPAEKWEAYLIFKAGLAAQLTPGQ